jgi:hypothetical protein
VPRLRTGSMGVASGLALFMMTGLHGDANPRLPRFQYLPVPSRLPTSGICCAEAEPYSSSHGLIGATKLAAVVLKPSARRVFRLPFYFTVISDALLGTPLTETNTA